MTDAPEMQAAIPVLPDNLPGLLEKQYGPSLTEKIVAGYGCRRPVTLRVNPLKGTMEEVTATLTAAGITYEPVSWYSDALILPDTTEAAVQALPLFESGKIYMQSLSAMIPPLMMDLTKGKTILDMAAAPGGKTTQMAALSGNQVLITACERHPIRAEKLRYNLELQGARGTNVMLQDARQLDDFFSFDSILLDAPCSGSGTIQLLPGDPQRRMAPDWLRKTAATQAAMLTKALRLLKPGGTMVYSTCSILAMENEQVLNRVLPNYNVKILPIEADSMGLPQLPVTIPGTLCICPDRLYEGFFIARIQKLKK